MGRWILLWCTCFVLNHSQAQKYGNEWYDATKPYVRFGITENGLYRVDYYVLDNFLREAGTSIRLIPSSKLQIWSRGKQIPITVSATTATRNGLHFRRLPGIGAMNGK